MYFLVFALMFGLVQLSYAIAFAASLSEGITANETEIKTYCAATLEDDFADDKVLVALTNTVSLSFYDYSASDFSEIQCGSVSNLTQTVTELAKQKLTNAAESSNISSVSDDMLPNIKDINVDTFNQVLCLYLEEPGKDKVLEAIKLLEKRSDILCASPDYVVSACATTPNDPYYNEQWAASKIQLPQAWDITKGSSAVTVGVVDTGIDRYHPDLEGKIDFAKSWDFVAGNGGTEISTVDLHGHGTHVAGIIAAAGHNNTGISGIGWNVKVASLRVMDRDAEGYTSTVLLAVEHAINNSIPILNISLSWEAVPGTSEENTPVKEMMENYNGLIVCAAGNKARDLDTSTKKDYPAYFDLPNIIVVGSSSSTDGRGVSTNYGKNSVDIFAPGTEILSCYPTQMCTSGTHDVENSIHYANGYHEMNGTSMAAPHVAGIAALILSKHPGLSYIKLKSGIMDNSDKVFELSCSSGGRLNAYKAVADTHDYRYTYTTTQHTGTCSCGERVTGTHTFDASGSALYCTVCGYTSSIIINGGTEPEA